MTTFVNYFQRKLRRKKPRSPVSEKSFGTIFDVPSRVMEPEEISPPSRRLTFDSEVTQVDRVGHTSKDSATLFSDPESPDLPATPPTHRASTSKTLVNTESPTEEDAPSKPSKGDSSTAFDELSGAFCSDLDAEVVLLILNDLFGTTYTLDDEGIESLLNSFVTEGLTVEEAANKVTLVWYNFAALGAKKARLRYESDELAPAATTGEGNYIGKITMTSQGHVSKESVATAKPRDKESKVLLNALSDTFCSDLQGAEDVLQTLNLILEPPTHYPLSFDHPGIKALFESFVDQGLDVGGVYARVRSSWPKISERRTTVGNLEEEFLERLSILESRGDEHERTRRNCVTGGSIESPNSVKPRRIWDLYANRVVPFHYCLVENDRLEIGRNSSVWAISHSWTSDMVADYTSINGYEWPVPVPSRVKLETVRKELIDHGAEYVWLDVLCLRQKSEDEQKEKTRREEWAVDVPTIGSVYITEASYVMRYMNGLGRTFSNSGWSDPRHWTMRAWTLQEMKHNSVLGGVPPNARDPMLQKSKETGQLLRDRLKPIMDLQASLTHRINIKKIMEIVICMRERFSTNPVDKVAGITMLLHPPTLPVYDETMDAENAWNHCIRHLKPELWAELLFGINAPGDAGVSWHSSWKQLMSPEFPTTTVWTREARALEVTLDGRLLCKASVIPAELISFRSDHLAEGTMRFRRGDETLDLQMPFPEFKLTLPKGDYVLVGNLEGNPLFWVVCVKDGENFLKRAVVRIEPSGNDRLRSFFGNDLPRRLCYFS